MSVKFENYERENALFRERIRANIDEVVCLKSEYEHEKYIEDFQSEFAKYNGSGYVIAVNSGTTALELALSASRVKEKDEVILPSYTYISTALAVSNLGAAPVFVDIKNGTFTIDPEKIEEKLTKKTKAIMPVHIHGNPCEMDKIVKIARKNKLAIVEDCSHAHGAEYKNKKVGNFGIGCFSCHTTKIFSGIGNSGLITINEKEKYETIKQMIFLKNDPELTLSKRAPCTMDAIQAAILKAKLPYLDKIIEKKRKTARAYMQSLSRDMRYQKEEDGAKHVYRDFIIGIKNRDKMKKHLESFGVMTKIRYPVPLHLVKYYRDLKCKKNNLFETMKVADEALSLPISYALSEEDMQYICKILKGCDDKFREE
ncbi:MAG: DegT/DnrJ/EryC1/StrS family aminotransferase [Candidatus Omnitrophota bacterium]